MEFRFPEVEALLARMHRIADDRRSAFSNRIRHLQKMHFPPGTNSGRGKAVVYSVRHIAQLALIFEFAQIGVQPERATKIYTAHATALTSAMTDAVGTLLSDDHFPLLLIFDPAGLSELQDRDPEESSAGIDDAVITFQVMPIGSLAEQFADWTQGYFRRAAMINLTDMIDDLSARLAELAEASQGKVLAVLRDSLRDIESSKNGNP